MSLIPWPYRWLALVLLAAALIGFGWIKGAGHVQAQWDAAGGSAMHERLAAVDPLSAARIHANDKLRVVRALEVYEQTGVPLGEARREHALGRPRYRALSYVLDLPSAEHRSRVAERVDAMIAGGFVAEVAAGRLVGVHCVLDPGRLHCGDRGGRGGAASSFVPGHGPSLIK